MYTTSKKSTTSSLFLHIFKVFVTYLYHRWTLIQPYTVAPIKLTFSADFIQQFLKKWSSPTLFTLIQNSAGFHIKKDGPIVFSILTIIALFVILMIVLTSIAIARGNLDFVAEDAKNVDSAEEFFE